MNSFGGPSILVFGAVIVLICILIGARRGFIKQMISLVSLVVAFALAWMLCGPVANAAYNGFIESKVCESISSAIESVDVEELTADIVTEKIPEFVTDYAEKAGVSIAEIVDGKMNVTEDKAQDIAVAINEKIARPVIIKIVTAIVFVLLFIIVRIIIKIVLRAVDLVSKLPVIKTANKLLGGVLGGIKGALICGVLIYILSLIL